MGRHLAAIPLMASPKTAVYVYCVVRAARRPAASRVPEPLPGASAPELTSIDSSLHLVTSNVPLAVYGPSQLEPRLRDLDWVSQVAVAHERVIEHFARRPALTVVPMKMFAMFSTIDKAMADVRGRRREIDRVMKRIEGSEEWGIRVTKTSDPAGTGVTRGGRAASGSAPTTGTAFLTARKHARDSAAASKTAARAAAETAFARLKRAARAARRRDGRPEPGSNPPVLEAAFLVRSDGRKRFIEEARRQAAGCASAGAALVLTGPWPVYNFVESSEDSE